jgi:glycosyltransferase involved in cell wall biosynthesis
MSSVLYWAPCLDKVATIKAVLSSAKSVNRYYSKKYKVSILNIIGELNDYYTKKIDFLSLTNFNLFKLLPKKGFLRSRFSYIVFILFAFYPLIKILKKNKPKFLIIHLITSLPIILFIIFNFETKLILRISGLPKLNFLRRLLWKLANQKIYKITCPTEETYKYIKKLGIFNENKLVVLYDPIIEINKYKKIHTHDNSLINKQIIAVGRLTRQKNHIFLVRTFAKILKIYPHLKLKICGDGENYKKIKTQAKELNILDKVDLSGYVEDVTMVMKNSLCLLSTSLWEDPGFVMIEAAMSNTFVISSNCPNGPEEFIDNDSAGLLFDSNNAESLIKKFKQFMNMNEEEKLIKKINAKKKLKKYTIFMHAKKLNGVLSNEKQ